MSEQRDDSIDAELRSMATERLEAELCSVAAHLAAATCRFLLLVAEFDRRAAWDAWECRSAAQWLSWKCGLGMGAAREHVRVAGRLDEMPLVRAAFATGRLSYSKVRAISRVCHPGIERGLVSMAEHATAWQLEQACGRLRRCFDREDEERQLQRNEETGRARAHCTVSTDDQGHGVGRFRLPPQDADVLRRALATAKAGLPEVDPLTGATHERTNAAALVELARSYLADPQTGPGPQPEIIVHLGLAALRSFIHAQDGDPAPTARDVPAETCPAETCGAETCGAETCGAETGGRWSDHEDRSDHDPVDPVVAMAAATWPVHTSTGAAVSLALFARLACDAGIRHVVDLPDGSQLDLGRHRRVPNAPLRRALLARDVHCRFPGCSTRHGLVAHHIIWWVFGGRTDQANLIMLCPKHHHAIHDRQWDCSGTADALVFARPDGRRVDPVPPPMSGSLGDLISAHEECGLDVDVEHPGGRWQGDHIDWDCFYAAFAAPARPAG